MPNVQWKTPDDGQRNCPEHVEFLDKNKFRELVRVLVLLKRNTNHNCKVGWLSRYTGRQRHLITNRGYNLMTSPHSRPANLLSNEYLETVLGIKLHLQQAERSPLY